MERAAQELGPGKPRVSALQSCPGVVHKLAGDSESKQYPQPQGCLRALGLTFGFFGMSQAEHHRTQTRHSHAELARGGKHGAFWGRKQGRRLSEQQEMGARCPGTVLRLPLPSRRPLPSPFCQAPDAPRAA